MRKNIRYLFLYLIMILGTVGCYKDDDNKNDIINQLNDTAWQIESKTISGEEFELSDCEKGYMIYFENKGILKTYDACEDVIHRSGWSFKGDLLNLSNDLPASYKIEEIGNILVLRRLDFKDGELITTIIKSIRVENTIFPTKK